MSESLREIVFDTETTGFNYSGDDRIVEIGCVEMLNHTPTGRTFHCYINPEREVPEEVVRVHGLTTQFLSDKPKFAEIAKDFVEFIGDANMVAHNAVFDMNFINAEFRRANMPEVSFDRMVDTLAISRKKNPHLAKHNLDSLCNRYGIDNSHRELHGALLDARLLAEVYIELLGGKEVDFFKTSDEEMEITASTQNKIKKKPFRPARNFPIPEADLKNHNDFVTSLGDNVIWNKKESAI
ncbi:MAG: DNA polymerase III subunit epsilon [Alphaproteobacteria bacterium]